MSWKRLFTASLAPERLHFAAHSHHLWPDVVAEAHSQAYRDAVELADQKWDRILGEVVPEMQRRVALRLELPDPASIAIAPNTHELVMRVRSCLPTPMRVLTTDAEFHSFTRQLSRWEEAGDATATRVPAEPFETFVERFAAAARTGNHDLVHLSHVFFNSGFAVPDLASLVGEIPDGPFVVIDGYHGFMALPTDLSSIADRVFYVAGGYKYAMAGEGACFMHCPPGYGDRPVDTGWFAGFGALSDPRDPTVGYGPGGERFMGATFDPSGVYRFNAVQRMLDTEGLDVSAIHAHVEGLQRRFIRAYGDRPPGELLPPCDSTGDRGHFLTFRTGDAAAIQVRLAVSGVVTDRRGDRLRLGFGIYHDDDDVDRLHRHLVDVATD